MRFRLPWRVVLPPLLLVGCSDLGDPLRREARCEVTAGQLDFGSVALADTGFRDVTLRNAGNAPLTGNVRVTCPDFLLKWGGGSFTLAPDETLAIRVAFTQPAAGSFACLLDLGTGCPGIPLAGASVQQLPGAVCQVSAAALDFGAVSVGGASDLPFTLTNIGSADLRVNPVSPCAAFAVVAGGGPRILSPLDSVVVTVRFLPDAVSAFPCTIATGPGCPDVTLSGTGSPALTVSFANDIQPIFNFYCTGCHGGSGGLFLTQGTSYSNLVNVPSAYEPFLRVAPGDPENSVLFGKVTSTTFGAKMPPGGSITQSEKNKIETWILEGAHDNGPARPARPARLMTARGRR